MKKRGRGRCGKDGGAFLRRRCRVTTNDSGPRRPPFVSPCLFPLENSVTLYVATFFSLLIVTFLDVSLKKRRTFSLERLVERFTALFPLLDVH